MNTEPRSLIEQLEAAPSLPAGSNERFNGYGVMGLPFRSGHVLAMRRFVASSVGPSYTSVWHRNPDGEWVFYANVPPRQACARYFGALASDAVETEITLAWAAPNRLRVTMPTSRFDWEVEVAATSGTRFMSAMARLLPSIAWRNPAVLATMGMVAGPMLSVGRVGMRGHVPNGQWFVANPRMLWAVVHSRALMAGLDFGPPGPVRPQASLGDFWIPQRGLLAIGQSYFDTFDPAVHSTSTFRASAPGMRTTD